MSSNTRQRWLLVLFPTIILSLIAFGYLRPTRELAGLRRTAVASSEVSSNESLLNTMREQRASIVKELSDLAGKRDEYLQRWQQLRVNLSQSSDRSRKLNLVMDVFKRHDLHVILKEGSATDREIQGGINRVLKRLSQPADATFTELRTLKPQDTEGAPSSTVAEEQIGDKRLAWEVRFAATYDQARNALHELSQIDSSITPLSIEMKTARHDLKLREWRLILNY